MTCLTFLVSWAALSIFTLGAYTLFVLLVKHRTNGPYRCVQCKSIVTQYEYPYCAKCLEALDEEGFFEEEEIPNG